MFVHDFCFGLCGIPYGCFAIYVIGNLRVTAKCLNDLCICIADRQYIQIKRATVLPPLFLFVLKLLLSFAAV